MTRACLRTPLEKPMSVRLEIQKPGYTAFNTPLLTIAGVAEALGLSRNAVHKMVNRGELTPIIIERDEDRIRQRWFLESEVEELARRRAAAGD